MPNLKLSFKIDLSKLIKPFKRFFGKVPEFIAKKSFVLFWLVLVLIFLIDGLIFYRYLWKVNVQKIHVEINQAQVSEEANQKFLDFFGKRKEILNQASQEYTDIFFR